MKKVTAVFRPDRFDHVVRELEQRGYSGFTIIDVRGHGQSPENVGEWRGQTYELLVTHKLQVEIIVEDDEAEGAAAAVIAGAHTGELGDGLITVTDLGQVYSIRNGMPAPAAVAGSEPTTP